MTDVCGKIVGLSCSTEDVGFKVNIHLYESTFSVSWDIGATSVSRLLAELMILVRFVHNKTIYIITDLYVYNKDIGDLINIIMDFFAKTK